jgi:hypothetical protein
MWWPPVSVARFAFTISLPHVTRVALAASTPQKSTLGPLFATSPGNRLELIAIAHLAMVVALSEWLS